MLPQEIWMDAAKKCHAMVLGVGPPRLPAVIFRCLLTEVSEPSEDAEPPKAVSE